MIVKNKRIPAPPYQLMDCLLRKPFSYDIALFLSIITFNILFLLTKTWAFSKPFVEESDFEMLTLNGLFAGLVLAPVVEEFAFRGIFLFAKRRSWSVIYMPVMVFLILVFVKMHDGMEGMTLLSLLALVGLLTYFFYENGVHFIKKNSELIICLTALLFAAVHIHNYEVHSLDNYLGLIPRFLGGLFFGYVALKYGLLAAMGFHFGNNLLVVVIAFIQRMVFDFPDQGL